MSRVARLEFRRVKTEILIKHLSEVLKQEGIVAEEEGLRIVARCSEGSVRDAMTLLDKVIAFANDEQHISSEEIRTVLAQSGADSVADLVQTVFDRKPQECLEQLEMMTATGSDILQLSLSILQHFRDLTVIKLCASPEALLDMSEVMQERLIEQAKAVDANHISQCFDRFSTGHRATP